MRYHPTFDQISAEETHFGTLMQTGAIRVYDIASSGAWTNEFAFLQLDDKKNIYNIYYAIGSDYKRIKLLNSIKKLNQQETNAVIDCFDIEYINPDLWIVDCIKKISATSTQWQQKRINLARAVYNDADIDLFDDPMSALDIKVKYQINQQCIQGYLNNKTPILFTNSLSNFQE